MLLSPLRNWLADILNALPIGTTKVDALDDDEADLLAKAKVALRPLLFGPAHVRDIVRRPFFANVLYQSFAAQSGGPPFEPQSEVDDHVPGEGRTAHLRRHQLFPRRRQVHPGTAAR